MSTCAVGPCQQPRIEGTSYCAKHGPTTSTHPKVDVNRHGTQAPAMVCPHCQTKGGVRTRTVKRTKGVQSGKAASAVVTGGASLLWLGIGKKSRHTVAHCDVCKADWPIN